MWYQRGYELLKAVTPRTFEVMAQFSTACSKMAREYSHRKNPEAQSRYAAEYVQVTKEIMGMDTRNLPEFQKERLSLIQNDFLLEEAEQTARENVQLALKYRGEKYKDYLSQLEILAHVHELKK